MTPVHLITLCDRDLGPENELVASCRRHGTPLTVVTRRGPWLANALKIGMLGRHLASADYGDEDVVFVVDALDVVVEADPGRLRAGFESFAADVVFGAEANYYFADKALRFRYWEHYPRSAGPYRYLNSGTFAGRARALRELLETVCARYEIDPEDDEGLRKLRSDQLLYSRLYVDQAHGAPGPRIVLDDRQRLFGCAGGRMFVDPEAAAPGLESFLAFRATRSRLRKVGLLRFQDGCVDLESTPEGFANRLTNTRPPIVHLPGTHRHFGRALARLRGQEPANGALRELARALERRGRHAAERETAREAENAGRGGSRRRRGLGRWTAPTPPCPDCRPPPPSAGPRDDGLPSEHPQPHGSAPQ